MKEDKFIITPKEEPSITITIRIQPETNAKLEELARQSNRSRNELINKALSFALSNVEFVDNKENE
jgi:predicted transcriptional regulator